MARHCFAVCEIECLWVGPERGFESDPRHSSFVVDVFTHLGTP